MDQWCWIDLEFSCWTIGTWILCTVIFCVCRENVAENRKRHCAILKSFPCPLLSVLYGKAFIVRFQLHVHVQRCTYGRSNLKRHIWCLAIFLYNYVLTFGLRYFFNYRHFNSFGSLITCTVVCMCTIYMYSLQICKQTTYWYHDCFLSSFLAFSFICIFIIMLRVLVFKISML